MNLKEREVLKLEEEFRDKIENELAKQQSKDRKVVIKDIKLVGEASWKDKVNGKSIAKNLFIVEREIIELDEEGKQRITEDINYYLGNECIAASLGMDIIIYKNSIKNSEPEKMDAVEELLERTPEEQIEKNSLKYLKEKEKTENLSNEKSEILLGQKSKKDKKVLSNKQTEQIKVNGIQKVDLNKLVDGKETLGKRLDLEDYNSIYIVYSEKVKEVSPDAKINNTTYSLIGTGKDGQVRVLNDEFEMDKTAGNNGDRKSSKIRADGTATRDNHDLSVYTRKTNGASIGCENNKGNVDLFLYEKTLEENENVGIQIETSKTPVIPMEVREIMNRENGTMQKEKVQDEIQEHTDDGCNPDNPDDFDGDAETYTHIHSIDEYVDEVLNYENDKGEENIKQFFTEGEVREKLLKEFKENKDKISIEQIVQDVKEEMNLDAENFLREHNIH